MDLEKIKQGAKLILEGIGEDPEREGFMDTPERNARMCEEIFGGLEQDAAEHFEKKFHATSNNMVLEKDITFYSVCEHHLEPKGVMVLLEAEHMCMTMRGVQKPGTKTVTTIVRGAFAEDMMLQQTFLQMVNKG